MRLSTHLVTLHLSETFAISRLTVDSMETCFVVLEHDGVVAYGEGASVGYAGETAGDLAAAIDADGRSLLGDDLGEPDAVFRRLAGWDGPSGAKMALDGAIHDWWGKRVGQPVWRLLGGSRVLPGTTGFTIGIAGVEETVAKVRRAPAVGALKVKVGGPEDLERLGAIREVTALPLRIDANEGWTLDTARALTPRLVELGVDLLEQPFPADAVADHRRYHEWPDRLPLFLDEGCSDVDSVIRASEHADGVVVKLSKSGGISGAREVMRAAKAHGLQVMLSCMVESQLGICQAAQLAPLADWIDLDSHLMLDSAPFRGLGLDDGRIVLTGAPGLGLTPAEPFGLWAGQPSASPDTRPTRS